jgi:excisionase family DNA binding protein
MNAPRTRYLSTANAAQMLGVGPTSVKRWADLGLLKCVRTAGNHRRFTHEEVERFARAVQAGQVALDGSGGSSVPTEPPRPPAPPPDAETIAWTDRLLALGPYALHGALLAERQALGSWWKVADVVGAALGELGSRWECGKISVIDEHLASERLARGLARCAESLPTPAGAPTALLAVAGGDEHTLGLALAELVLREAGYDIGWLGRHTPGEYLAAHVRVHPAAIVALSASQCSHDPAALRAATLPVANACAARGSRLVLGGNGRWPTDLPAAVRVHDFAGLHDLLTAEQQPLSSAAQ